MTSCRKEFFPPKTAVTKHQCLDSPRKPLETIIISQPSTQLSVLCPCDGALSPVSYPRVLCTASKFTSGHRRAEDSSTLPAGDNEGHTPLKSHFFSRTYVFKQWHSNVLVLTSFSRFPGCSWKKPTGGTLPSRTRPEKVRYITHRKPPFCKRRSCFQKSVGTWGERWEQRGSTLSGWKCLRTSKADLWPPGKAGYWKRRHSHRLGNF